MKWTMKAGAQQDSLKRAVRVWFTKAQMPAKIIDEDEAVEEQSLEEVAMGLSERIEIWTEDLKASARAEGKAEGLAEGEAKGKIEEQYRMAKKMLAVGIPMSQVMEVTGLLEVELRRLIENTRKS